MFDYRYHALSLAAVLLALALGVLLGVAIGDSSFVSSAKNGIVHNLSTEVTQVRKQSERLQGRVAGEEAFADALYPLAVHEVLAGRSVGLVFLGASSNQVNSFVRSAVAQAGGNVTTVIAVREPVELSAIAHEATGTHFEGIADPGSNTLVGSFGELVGRQLVSGGPLVAHELISRVRSSLLSVFDGQLTRLEGVVIARAEPTGMSTQESEAANALESGLLHGIAAVGVPSVGVELTSTEPSQVPWYRGKGISSVDDLDQLAGQAALDFALAGDAGTFGVRSTADSLLPSVGSSTQP